MSERKDYKRELRRELAMEREFLVRIRKYVRDDTSLEMGYNLIDCEKERIRRIYEWMGEDDA